MTNCKRNEECETCGGEERVDCGGCTSSPVRGQPYCPGHTCPDCHGTGRGCAGGEPVVRVLTTEVNGEETRIIRRVCPSCGWEVKE